jgi:peptidylprolyl isomerase
VVDNSFHTLTLELDTGTVKIKFRPDLAPNHVQRIGELANEGFYNDVPFHRVIDGFMAQGGDGGRKNGTGGSSKPNLKQEFNAEPHARGVCSMARTNDPNSANSQFFICLESARRPSNQRSRCRAGLSQEFVSCGGNESERATQHSSNTEQ